MLPASVVLLEEIGEQSRCQKEKAAKFRQIHSPNPLPYNDLEKIIPRGCRLMAIGKRRQTATDDSAAPRDHATITLHDQHYDHMAALA
jgi:hypothetical protein